MWEILGGYLSAAPAVIQTGVAIAVGCLIILAPVALVMLFIVVFVKDVAVGPVQISSRKRRSRRTNDRK